MGDLDFEELDKAVNNLMNKAVGMQSDDTTPTTVSLDNTLRPGEKPNHGMVQAVAGGIDGGMSNEQRTVMQNLATPSPAIDPQAVPNPITQTPATFTGPVTPSFAMQPSPTDVSTPSTPDKSDESVVAGITPDSVPPQKSPRLAVPRPSSGRFMDVVHPSSDMMKSQPGPSLIVPTRAELSSSPASLTSAPTARSEESLANKTTVPLEPTTESETPPAIQDISSLTPFLPDANAKVEKRPLGFTSEIEKSVDSIEPKAVEISATPDVPFESSFSESFKKDNNTVEGTDEVQPINGEFDKPTVQSDMDDNQKLIDPTSIVPSSLPHNKELQSIESAEVEGADSKQDDAEPIPSPAVDAKQDAVRAVESGDTGHLSNSAGAIKGAESAGDKNGDIFDVKNNHHPAIHPVEQRSGWLTVVIVICVIVVCVGIAAAAYFILGLGV